MRVHVFIATTAGPVRVQSIERFTQPEQEPRIDSHMGVNGLGVAGFHSTYVQFVNLVIGRRFGHRQFIASVERDIQQGESWRLAVLLAHAVEADATRILSDKAVGAGHWVVLATGKVTNHLRIESVDSIAEKFESARTHLDAWLDAGSRVAVVVPTGNRNDVPPQFLTYCRNSNRLTFVDSDNVDDLLSLLSYSGFLLGTVPVTATSTERKAEVSAEMHTALASRSPTRRGWKGGWWMIAGVLCLVAILASKESLPDSMRDAINLSRDLGEWVMTEVAKLVEFGVTTASPENSRDSEERNDHGKLTIDARATSVDPVPASQSEREFQQMESDALPTSESVRGLAPAMPRRNHVATDPKTMGRGTGNDLGRIQTPAMREYLKLLEMMPPPPRIVVEDSGDSRLNLLVLPFSGGGHIQRRVTETIWKRTASIMEEKLRHSGYKPETNDLLHPMPQPDMDKGQLLHLARSTFAGYAMLLELHLDRRDYPTGNRIHVRLMASLIDLNAGDDSSAQMEERDWTRIPSRCDAQCENRAIDRVVGRVAEKISEETRARLSKQNPNMTTYNYRLSFCGLTREQRAGIEFELPRIPEYVSHLSLYAGNTRAEWKYVSRSGAEQLVRKLNAAVKYEGLDIDVLLWPERGSLSLKSSCP